MEPLSRLPVECLEHIPRCIGSHSTLSVRTLSSLRLVNRHLSLITFPFLLEVLLKFHHDIHFPQNKRRPRARVVTLLSNSTTIPLADLHPALAFELDIDNTFDNTFNDTTSSVDSAPSQIDYLRNVRNINLGIHTF